MWINCFPARVEKKNDLTTVIFAQTFLPKVHKPTDMNHILWETRYIAPRSIHLDDDIRLIFSAKRHKRLFRKESAAASHLIAGFFKTTTHGP
jgi:hypothetical protein